MYVLAETTVHRRQLIIGAPAMWFASPAVATPEEAKVETLEALLEKLRSKINEDMPDVRKVEISYDPTNKKVPLMVLAMRV